MKKLATLIVSLMLGCFALMAEEGTWELISKSGNGIGNGGRDDEVGIIVNQSDGTLYAFGVFEQVSMKTASGVAKYDGTTWSPVEGVECEVKVENNYSSEIAYCQYGDIAYASYIKWNGEVLQPAKWDGSNWTQMGEEIKFVIDICTDQDGNVFLIAYDSPANTQWNRVYQWQDGAWKIIGTSDGSVQGRADEYKKITTDSNNNLYVVGEFEKINDTIVNNIAKWDGESWSSLGSGSDDIIKHIAIDGKGTIFISGEFEKIDGKDIERTAQWDGSSWEEFDISRAEALKIGYAPRLLNGNSGEILLHPYNSVKTVYSYSSSTQKLLTIYEDVRVTSGDRYDNKICPIGNYIYVHGDMMELDGEDALCVARFRLSSIPEGKKQVTFSTNDNNGTIQGETNQLVEVGEDCSEVRAIPNDGYKFSKWTLNDTTYSTNDSLIVKNVTQDMNLIAHFAKQAAKQYRVKFYAKDNNGYVSGETVQMVYEGNNTSSVKATGYGGYKFFKWTLNDEDYSTRNPLIVGKVNDNMEVVAVFIEDVDDNGDDDDDDDDKPIEEPIDEIIGDFEDDNSIINTTINSSFTIPSSNRLKSYFANPKVKVYALIEGKKKMLKVLSQSSSSMTCILTRKAKVGTYQLIVEDKKSKSQKTITNNFNIMLPNVFSVTIDNEIVIKGQFFGGKKPKVFLRHGRKKLRCKVISYDDRLIICKPNKNYVVNYEHTLFVKTKGGVGTYKLEAKQ